MSVSAETIKEFKKYISPAMKGHTGGKTEFSMDWTGFGDFDVQKGSYFPLTYVSVRQEVLTTLLSVGSQMEDITKRIIFGR